VQPWTTGKVRVDMGKVGWSRRCDLDGASLPQSAEFILARTHGENRTPVPPSEPVPFCPVFLLFLPVLLTGPRLLFDPSPGSQLDSSGHSSPPYAKASFSIVAFVPYTGRRGGLVPDDGSPSFWGGCECSEGRGGTEPERRMRESAWSRWAWVMR